MRINIYQIDGDKDTNRVKFEGYEETLKYGGINPATYKCVFPDDEAPLGLKTHKNQVLTAFAAFC